MSSAPPEKPKFDLGPGWEKLPRLHFTREDPPSAAVEEAQADVAYGVRSLGTLAAEFRNRKQRLMPKA